MMDEKAVLDIHKLRKTDERARDEEAGAYDTRGRAQEEKNKEFLVGVSVPILLLLLGGI